MTAVPPPGRVARVRYYAGDTFVVEHRPDGAPTGPGVVILPPLGYEDTCAYRPLRILADRLAARGAVVMRIDWPSLGDSALDDGAPDLVDRWVATAREAAASLRRRGAPRVVGIGLRAGGLLALAASAFDELALWAPPLTGKALMREERAFHKMAERYFGTPVEGHPPPPAGSVEAGGFLYGAPTVAALEPLVAAELVAAHPPGRVLLLPRDGGEPAPKLVEALRAAGTSVASGPGVGLADLLENPYQSRILAPVEEALLAFCGPEGAAWPLAAPGGADHLALPGGGTERPWVKAGGAGELSGIVCEPAGGAPPGAVWTIFFNAGGIRRSGPTRLWTRAARELAATGRPSIRFDVRDVGDSDGATLPHETLDEMYSQSSVDDGLVAVDDAFDRGASAVDVVGLCSGAFFGMHVAAQRQVRHATLINGPAYIWNEAARHAGMTNQIARSLFDGRRWRRLLSGRIDPRALARSTVSEARISAARVVARARGDAPPDEVTEIIRRVQGRGTRLHFICSAGDPSIPYLDRHLAPDMHPRRTVLPGVDHTVRPVWAHTELVALVTTPDATPVPSPGSAPPGRATATPGAP